MRVASVSSLWVDPLGVWKEGQKRVGVWLAPEGDLDGEEAGGIEDREESYRLVGGVEGIFVLRLGKEEDVGQVRLRVRCPARSQPFALFHRRLRSYLITDDPHIGLYTNSRPSCTSPF